MPENFPSSFHTSRLRISPQPSAWPVGIQCSQSVPLEASTGKSSYFLGFRIGVHGPDSQLWLFP